MLAAAALGIPAHKVLTRVKRLGMMYNSSGVISVNMYKLIFYFKVVGLVAKKHAIACFQLPWLWLLISMLSIYSFIIISIGIYTIFYRLKVPIRLMLDRNEDMRTTGTRHPYLGKYKVAN